MIAGDFSIATIEKSPAIMEEGSWLAVVDLARRWAIMDGRPSCMDKQACAEQARARAC